MSLQRLDGDDGPPDTIARWVSVLGPARQLAEVLARTDFVPKGMRDNPDAVCAAILYGDELGLGPMQSLAGLDVVEGKPRPSAELARALILREGHTLTVHEATGTRVRVSGLRMGRPESERVTVEWTTDMARAAGLMNKNNWRSYPRAMLMARATSDLARILFPDVVKGLGYVSEAASQVADLDAWAPETSPTPEPGDERPPVAPIGRRRPPTDPPEGLRGPTGVGGDGGRPAIPVPTLPPEEPPGPDPVMADDTKPLHQVQKRGIFAAIGKLLGPNAQRDVRLGLVSAILGRPIGSTNDLTRTDGYVVMGWFDALDRGEVTWQHHPDDGTVTVGLRDDPPPDDDRPDDPWADMGGRAPA